MEHVRKQSSEIQTVRSTTNCQAPKRLAVTQSKPKSYSGGDIASGQAELLMKHKVLLEFIEGKNCMIDDLKNKLFMEDSSVATRIRSLQNLIQAEEAKVEKLVKRATSIHRLLPAEGNVDASQPVCNSDDDRNNSKIYVASSGRSQNSRGFLESKFSTELKECNKEILSTEQIIEGLDEKYVELNIELNSMQKNHERFIDTFDGPTNSDPDSDISSSSSDYSLKRKCTQVFYSSDMQSPPSTPVTAVQNQNHDKIRYQSRGKKQPHQHQYHQKKQTPSQQPKNKKQKKMNMDNKENLPPPPTQEHDKTPDLKDLLRILKNVFELPNAFSQSQPKDTASEIDLKELHAIIIALQQEQEQFRNVIQEQQNHLNGYHSKYIKAEKIIQTQKFEIEKLHSNNSKLENEININMDRLKSKFENKLLEVAHLPKLIRAEKIKSEKASKDNSILTTRLRVLQSEIGQQHQKLEETAKRKTATFNKLKATEKDLKIFKNQNNILKQEKRTLVDELNKLKTYLEGIQNTSTKSISRQRERTETERRNLQKRICNLELELNQSRNSTNCVIQERDKLIAEMQLQLNTLVHNFEVSQKHIRVLRRHIYSIGGTNNNSNIPEKLTAS